MPRIRYLCIRFANPIYPNEIPYFRAAVIEKTHRESNAFHNHDEAKGYLYRYPLIQYKVTYKKASIICLNEGTDEIHHLLGRRDLDFQIGKRREAYAIEDVRLHYHEVQTMDHRFYYSLLNWLPLNQRNHADWTALQDDLPGQAAMLTRILKGHILGFASGVDWQVDQTIHVEIDKIREMKLLPYKDTPMLAISLNFYSNVSLPEFIGLGKGSSVGFGVVKGIGGSFD
jgi:hypothetical protein